VKIVFGNCIGCFWAIFENLKERDLIHKGERFNTKGERFNTQRREI